MPSLARLDCLQVFVLQQRESSRSQENRPPLSGLNSFRAGISLITDRIEAGSHDACDHPCPSPLDLFTSVNVYTSRPGKETGESLKHSLSCFLGLGKVRPNGGHAELDEVPALVVVRGLPKPAPEIFENDTIISHPSERDGIDFAEDVTNLLQASEAVAVSEVARFEREENSVHGVLLWGVIAALDCILPL
jgi:hypothetical protein